MALDRRELADDMTLALQVAMDAQQSAIYTALPCVITKFDPAARTAEAQPLIQAQVTRVDGSTEWVNMPLLVDCPVIFPGGKGMSLTFPLVPGDEVLVLFASRCIDNWWALGGIQTQAEFRMHDLSDGFCLPQPLSRPVAQARAPVRMDAAELRSEDGSSAVSLLDSGDLEIKTPGTLTVDANSITVTATTIALNANVNVIGTFKVNGKDIGENHRHSGVVTGSNNSGGVV